VNIEKVENTKIIVSRISHPSKQFIINITKFEPLTYLEVFERIILY